MPTTPCLQRPTPFLRSPLIPPRLPLRTQPLPPTRTRPHPMPPPHRPQHRTRPNPMPPPLLPQHHTHPTLPHPTQPPPLQHSTPAPLPPPLPTQPLGEFRLIPLLRRSTPHHQAHLPTPHSLAQLRTPFPLAKPPTLHLPALPLIQHPLLCLQPLPQLTAVSMVLLLSPRLRPPAPKLPGSSCQHSTHSSPCSSRPCQHPAMRLLLPRPPGTETVSETGSVSATR
mmetsp:Transcript_27323/g.73870  ORF Transcript_27323/g.73870 Transcript_27323/m.73870 type:complete len:225 (+) Transcript_27323:449-1123(+)